MTTPLSSSRSKRTWPTLLWAISVLLVCSALIGLVVKIVASSGRPKAEPLRPPQQLAAGRQLTVWWDNLPTDVQNRSVLSGTESNVHPSDYVGPQKCKECHPGNYDLWSGHPHRWMNALASAATVKGDFSGEAAVSYRGGRATFEHRDDKYLMRLERDGVRRTYQINQTIGSRHFQYYVGKEIEGPEPSKHQFFTKDHVLGFGYWLEQKEWAPVVHIGQELEDWKRPEPFDPPYSGQYYAEYAASCNYCHTTFPLGDLFGRRTQQMGEHAPLPMHWSMRKYLEQAHPETLDAVVEQLTRDARRNPLADWEAPQYAATLGISCEACHLGARAHVESGGKAPPKFFPSSPHLSVEAEAGQLDFGRSHANLNWACGRCHVGARPTFAAGMSTWNSIEYTDAMLGSCYSELRCIDCHNPHRAIGPRWSASADHDDALCLKCHAKLEPAPQRLAHTHHPSGSDGARCMNCHMPRINEGLQDLVRTHMIYSPTRADMIEANHPNACNICHTDRPIDWTLRHLKEWYGASYSAAKLAAKYPDRDKPVGLAWLKSDNEAVRLVAADALLRSPDFKALPQLLDALDDPYLINRQFAYRGLQEKLKVRLADCGYRFYQTREERRKPLDEVRKRFSSVPGGPGH